jgi:hypothetical protein
VALLLELLELARLDLPRELRQAEQRKAMQGVPGEACGWDLPLARSFRPFRSLHSFTMLARTASNG